MKFIFLCLFTVFIAVIKPASAAIDSNSVQNYCQTIVAYRVSATSLMSIEVTEVKPLLKGEKWLVTGEIKNQKPVVTFACLAKTVNEKPELEKLELFQVKEEEKK